MFSALALNRKYRTNSLQWITFKTVLRRRLVFILFHVLRGLNEYLSGIGGWTGGGIASLKNHHKSWHINGEATTQT